MFRSHPARRAILGVHAKDKPLAPDVDLQAIAENTPGFSGADLANLVNEAALSATRKGRESITREDFAEHLRTEFSTFRWLLEPMLTAAGFTIVTDGFEGSIYGAYTCIRA